ncbi:unnamed protein product, partial [Arabidopsis halleri]
DFAQAFNTLALQDPSDSQWYMDSGATAHLTSGSGKNLQTIFNPSIRKTVIVGNGGCIPVAATGSLTLVNKPRPLSLQNVLVTPDIIKNLISVRRFTKDNTCSIEFDLFGFSIKDLHTKKTLLRSDSTGDLYPFFPSFNKNQAPALAFLTQTSEIWHQRLAHPSNDALKTLISSSFLQLNKKTPNLSCNACQLGKHVKLPFYSSTSTVSSPFQIIHSDLWTSPILSLSGIRYYVLFLDQFSHFLWVYPLRKKTLHNAVHILNLLPSSSIENKIPFSVLFNKAPSYTHLRVFGSLCYPHTNSGNKLEPRATPSVFLGYPLLHSGYRCFDLKTRKIIISRHVTFNETVFPFKLTKTQSGSAYDFLDDTEPSSIQKQLLLSPSLTPHSSHTPPASPVHEQPPINPPATVATQPHPMVTRSKQGIRKPKQILSLTIDSVSSLPKGYRQALLDPNWNPSMTDEYDALIKSNTWSLVPKPAGTNII